MKKIKMTAKDKIDNLVYNSSEFYTQSMWADLMNYHDLNDLNKFGYKLGESRYFACINYVAEIREILKDDEQIMVFNYYYHKFEVCHKWEDLFLTYDEAKAYRLELSIDEINFYD
jgi:hypothetical protein